MIFTEGRTPGTKSIVWKAIPSRLPLRTITLKSYSAPSRNIAVLITTLLLLGGVNIGNGDHLIGNEVMP